MSSTSTGSSTSKVTGWVGWVWFGAVIALTVGVLNFLGGLAAVFQPDTYVVADQTLFLFNPTGWGWVHLIWGIALVLLSICLFMGQGWARVATTVLVIINLVTQFLWLPATPWWSIIVIVLDVLVVWALIVHGGEVKRAVKD